MKISVVVAAYDEVNNVGPLLERLERALEERETWTFELIFVVAGTDGTREVVERAAEGSDRVRLIPEDRPSGLGNAFRRGFAEVSREADYVVTLDADLNHLPEDVPRLVDAAVETQCDIVIGSRNVRGSEVVGSPLWKSALSALGNRVLHWLYGLHVEDKTSGFRVYRADRLAELEYRSTGFAFLPEILIVASSRGLSIREEPIRFVFREEGRSKMAILPTTLSYFLLFLRRLRDDL